MIPRQLLFLIPLFLLMQTVDLSLKNERSSIPVSHDPMTVDTIRITQSTTQLGIIRRGQTIVLTGFQKNIFAKKTLVLKTINGNTLRGNITAAGNLRFNQVIFPNSEGDGPFGSSLDLDILNKYGRYKLIIGESLMGEQFTGKFIVKIKVQ